MVKYKKYKNIDGHRYKIYGTALTKRAAKELKSDAKEAGYKARVCGGASTKYRVYYHK